MGIFFLAVAALLAGGAGWSLARANPTWEGDADDAETMQYNYGPWWDIAPRPPLLAEGETPGCGTMFRHFMYGTGPALFCAIGAALLAYHGVAQLQGLTLSGKIMVWGAVAVAAVIGYIASRTTDKGPVGPLE